MPVAATASSPGRLRIAIDARELLRADRTGVERMLCEFIAHLDATRHDIDWLLLFDRHTPLVDQLAQRHPVRLIPPRHPRLQRLFDAWTAWQLGAALERAGVDVFYSPNTKFPLTGRVPAVVTVHGLEWAFHPQGYRRGERLRQRLWFELCLRRAAGIVTFADHTRGDIDRMGRARLRRKPPVRVVGEGVAAIFRRLAPHEIDPTLRARCAIGVPDQPYVLAVSSLVPRKNVEGLLHAFARLVAGGLPHRLVLVGKSGWRAGRLQDTVRRLDLEARVVFTGYIDDATLVQLYNQAALFAYPSFYEGFGLPILEAMACGTPVVTARASATAEVAGDAALLVDPASPAAIAQAMQRILTDPVLAADLRTRGAARVARYDWARMARAIATFLATLAGPASPTYDLPATSRTSPEGRG